MTIAETGKIATSGTTTVGNGATLDVTAVENAANAAIQGGTLNIAAGGTLRTTFANGYIIPADLLCD